MPHPIYIERRLCEEDSASVTALAHRLGIEPEPHPHVTLAYSTSPVDLTREAFALDAGELEVTPTKMYFDRFDNGAVVLVFENDAIRARHDEFRAAGASWDFPHYNSHITIGRAGEAASPLFLGDPYVDAPWTFGPERMKVNGSHIHPQLEEFGLHIDGVSTFRARAGEALLARFEADWNGTDEFVLWDPTFEMSGPFQIAGEVETLNAHVAMIEAHLDTILGDPDLLDEHGDLKP